MKLNINLLPQKLEEKAINKTALKWLKISGVILLGGAILLSFVLISYGLIINRQVEDIGNKNQQAEMTINTMKEKEGLLWYYKDRLDFIKKSFLTQLDFSQVLSEISAIIPEEMFIANLNLDKEGNIQLSLDAKNSQHLGSFLNALIANQKFLEPTVTSIVGDKDGNYKIGLTMRYQL